VTYLIRALLWKYYGTSVVAISSRGLVNYTDARVPTELARVNGARIMVVSEQQHHGLARAPNIRLQLLAFPRAVDLFALCFPSASRGAMDYILCKATEAALIAHGRQDHDQGPAPQ